MADWSSTDGRTEPPPIKALFVYNCNPVTQAAEQDKIVAGLAREDIHGGQRTVHDRHC